VYNFSLFEVKKENTMTSIKLNGAVLVPLAGLFVWLSLPLAQAQVTKDQLEAVGAKLQAPRAFFNKLSEQQRRMLSGSALNFFHVVQEWPNLQRQMLRGQMSLPSNPLADSTSANLIQSDVATTLGPVMVSKTSTDFAFGPAAGFTQSETSTAWCGTNVVVGFNDSGSFFQSAFATGGANLSFNGFARSTNQGVSFTDEGFLPSATANPANFLAGDPVIVCTSASTFYYSSLFFTATAVSSLSAISVSKSTNGGISFGAPVIAAAKNANTHTLDKDWMAVNPANPNQIAVTYTDFDISGTVCIGSERTAIELVASVNGGATWSAPQVVFQACAVAPNFPSVQGSQVAFSPTGAVNVAFELFSGALPTGRQIEFKRATTLGGAFGALVPVANVIGVGDGTVIQGGIRAFIDIQGMAIDRSGLSTNGNIYIVFHDSTNFVKSFGGNAYGYSDAMISKSTNNGVSWSVPVQVNTNTEPLASGRGTDSYMPGVAVDNTNGEVGVCWYDRRNDPLNFKVDRFCGHSVDAGATFTNDRMTTASFMPIHGADDLVNPSYFGDYDAVASDFLKGTSGFIGAFQTVRGAAGTSLVPNSDVKARNFN
jgi:hypothetical protein